MSAAHTPTPWELCNDRDGFWIERQGVQIATVSHEKDNAGLGDGEGEANARRIVQCVNAHDELVAGARHLIAYEDAMNGDDHIAAMHHYAMAVDTLRAALAKAGGAA